MDRYFVFIDESGNSAFDKLQNENTFSGENYLIFGATVVNETDIDLIKKTLLSIKSSIKKETLHFTEIRKHYEKLYILKELSEKCFFTSFSVISNKKSLFKQNREYKPKNYIQFYNKNLIYLFEKINCFIKEKNIDKSNVYFFVEQSNSFNLKVFQNYVDTIRGNGKPFYLNHINTFNIQIREKKETDLFFLADMIAASMYQIVHGQFIAGRQIIEPRYFHILLPHIFKKNGSIMEFGIKFVHTLDDLELSQEAKEYFLSIDNI